MQKQSYYPQNKLNRLSLIGDSDLTKIANEFLFRIEETTTKDFSSVVTITSLSAVSTASIKSLAIASSGSAPSTLTLTKLKNRLSGVSYTTTSSVVETSLRGSSKVVVSASTSNLSQNSLKSISIISVTSSNTSLTSLNLKGSQKPLSVSQNTLINSNFNKLIQSALHITQQNSISALARRWSGGGGATGLISSLGATNIKSMRLSGTLAQLSDTTTFGRKYSSSLVSIQTSGTITMGYDVYVELMAILKDVELFVESSQSLGSQKGKNQDSLAILTSSIQSEQITNRLKNILLNNSVVIQTNASKAINKGELAILEDALISLYYTKYIPKGTIKVQNTTVTLSQNNVVGATLNPLVSNTSTTHTTSITQKVTLNEEVYTHDFRIHR